MDSSPAPSPALVNLETPQHRQAVNGAHALNVVPTATTYTSGVSSLEGHASGPPNRVLTDAFASCLGTPGWIQCPFSVLRMHDPGTADAMELPVWFPRSSALPRCLTWHHHSMSIADSLGSAQACTLAVIRRYKHASPPVRASHRRPVSIADTSSGRLWMLIIVHTPQMSIDS
jgi:hypothetical protein